MRVALFIPCYVDQLKPEVGLASLRLLEALGLEVVYPGDQTCCGQPFLTAGEAERAHRLGAHFVDVFGTGYDAVVTPSGSCAATIRQHLPRWIAGGAARDLASRTFELCEFLVEQRAEERLAGRFPFRVGLHASCHALRELRLGTASESREPKRLDPAATLLESLDGLELVELRRQDECCGFGGVFSLTEEAVSCRMGLDRLADHQGARAEVIASTDVSCLMHLEGLARKRALGLRMLHVAEILAAGLDAPTDREPIAQRAP